MALAATAATTPPWGTWATTQSPLSSSRYRLGFAGSGTAVVSRAKALPDPFTG
jgi:hypothetical protein